MLFNKVFYYACIAASAISPACQAAQFIYTYEGESTSLESSQFFSATGQITGTLSFSAPSNSNVYIGFNQNGIVQSTLGVTDLKLSFSDNVRFALEDGGSVDDFSGLYDVTGASTSGSSLNYLATNASGDVSTWRLGLSGSTQGSRSIGTGFGTSSSVQGNVHVDSGGIQLGIDSTRITTVLGPTGPTIVNNPWSLGRKIAEAPEHIIVLTHGFSPGRAKTDDNYMATLVPAISSQLDNAGIDLDTVAFVTRTWNEAYVPSVPQEYTSLTNGGLFPEVTLLPGENYASAVLRTAGADGITALQRFADSYNRAYDATEVEGSRLADAVTDLYLSARQDNKTPTLHFIGHSLGSIANAEAVGILHSRGITTNLATILDSPLQASRRVFEDQEGRIPLKARAASFDASFLFYSRMQAGSVDYVENFFGGDEVTITPPLPAFGQPIAGTAPATDGSLYGRFLPDANHGEVWNSFYRTEIENHGATTFWRTPALYGASKPYPDNAIWNPEPLLESMISRYNAVNALGYPAVLVFNALINPAFGDSILIDAANRRTGTIAFEDVGVRAISNSPSSFSTSMQLDSMMGFQFFFEVDGATTGILSIEVGDEVLWSMDLSSPEAMLSGTAYVSTSDFYGEHELVWTYDSDEIGSSWLVSGIRSLTVHEVPEPNTLALCGVIAIYFAARRKGGS